MNLGYNGFGGHYHVIHLATICLRLRGLCLNILVDSYGLKSSSRMSSVEVVAMFLWIVGAPQSVRQAEDRFRRSMETVSRTFDTILTSILKLAADNIAPKDPEFSTVHPNVENPDF